MAAVHLPQCLANLAQPNEDKAIFLQFFPFVKEIVYARLEDVGTFLFVPVRVVKVFMR